MNHQILVVDDSPKVHPLVKAILAKEPIDVHSATDAAYGLTLAASLRPHLILLDVDMPGMNGFEACRQLKNDAATAECPVIFLTAHSTYDEKVQAFGLGAIDYVTKPFNPGELLARVRSALRTHCVIRRLEETSVTDALTGLGNRAMFNGRLKAELGLRDRLQHSLSVTSLAIDQFRDIGDCYGPAVAEQAVLCVGRTIRETCRPEDVACRLSGEEFAIIQPHTAAAEATILADKIRKTVADHRLSPTATGNSLVNGHYVSMTVTYGVAEAGQPHDRSMLQRADDAMQRAMQSASIRHDSARLGGKTLAG